MRCCVFFLIVYLIFCFTFTCTLIDWIKLNRHTLHIYNYFFVCVPAINVFWIIYNSYKYKHKKKTKQQTLILCAQFVQLQNHQFDFFIYRSRNIFHYLFLNLVSSLSTRSRSFAVIVAHILFYFVIYNLFVFVYTFLGIKYERKTGLIIVMFI